MTDVAEYVKPLPLLTNLNRPFFEAALRGQLALQRCDACGQYWYPPAPTCPRCLSPRVTWTPVSGAGRVWSWIVMHQRYFPSFAADLPYNVAFVQLDEGPLLVTRIVGASSEQLRCDLPVRVEFERVTEEVALPVFRPVGAG